MSNKRFTPEKKIEIIEAYKTGKVAYSQLQAVYGINPKEIYVWVPKYEAHGKAAFERGSGNSRYTQELKIQCVGEYLRGEGSLL